jgi:hypothetical protein
MVYGAAPMMCPKLFPDFFSPWLIDPLTLNS